MTENAQKSTMSAAEIGERTSAWVAQVKKEHPGHPEQDVICAEPDVGVDPEQVGPLSNYSVDSDPDEQDHSTPIGQYYKEIQNTPAHTWLLATIGAQSQLDFSTTKARDRVRNAVASLMPHAVISKRHPPSAHTIVFVMNWKPLELAHQQHYPNLGDDLKRAITLTGTMCQAQGVTAQEYLSQVWPISSELLLDFLLQVTVSIPGKELLCMENKLQPF